MKLKNIIFLALVTLLLSACKKEVDEICVETCGWQQDCVNGECECPEGYYKIENSCEEIRENYFFGKLDCTCFDDFIIDLSFIPIGSIQYIWAGGSPMTELSSSNENVFKATFFFSFGEGCNFNGVLAEFVDFTVERLNDDEVNVHARWWTIADGTLAECESVFVH